MRLYHIAAIAKIILGLGILILVYTFVNVYEDPLFGIGLSIVGLFIASRGASFYLFFAIQKWFRNLSPDRLIKDSYKLSLLFGIFVIINALLIFLGYRSRFLGLILLVGFIILQVLLFSEQKEDTHGFPDI